MTEIMVVLGRIMQSISANPSWGYGLGFVLLIVANRMAASTAWSNVVLGLAWMIFIHAIYRTHPLPDQPILPRLLWTALCASVVGLFLFYCFWTLPPPRPLISARFLSIDQPDDYQIAGIHWRSIYSELRVNIVNRSHKHACDLNLRLKPTALVARTGCLEHSGNSQVTFEPATAARADFSGRVLNLAATDMGFRMYCSGLPPKGHVTIVLALVGGLRKEIENPTGLGDPRFWACLNLVEHGEKGVAFFANDPSADIYSERPITRPCLKVEGTFTAAQQELNILETVNPE